MAVPAFTFTQRVVPVAEIGRPGPLTPDEVSWADIGCDVYEITTDTGRGSASDRFAPGTATITASNVSGWADGVVPVEWSYFVDEFNRTGPALGSHWEHWGPVETDRGADVLELVDDGAQVVAHDPDEVMLLAAEPLTMRGHWHASGGSASTATVGPFPGVHAGDVIWLALAADYTLDTPTAPQPTIPGWTHIGPNTSWGAPLTYFRIWQHRVQPEEAASSATWTWTATLPLTVPWHWTAVAFGGVSVAAQRVVGGTSTFGTGSGFYYWTSLSSPLTMTTPVPGCVVLRIGGGQVHHAVDPETSLTVLEHAAATVDWTWSTLLAVEVVGGVIREWPSGTLIPDNQLDFTVAATAGEHAETITLMVIPGQAPDPDSIPQHGAGTAIWGLGYDGDQFVDVAMSGLAAPDRLWPTGSARVELALKANETDLAASVGVFAWQPAWVDPAVTGVVSWSIRHRGTTGSETVLASGTTTIGADGFPEPARLRFEADDDGGARIYLQGALLGSGTDSSPPAGDRVAVYAEYSAGALSIGGSDQMGPPRFESVVGGSNLPVPILLEPGVRVRIGVHHDTFGDRWFFHGYVDAIVPVYDPANRPVSRIECIDPLGEIGRLPLTDIGGFQPEEASQRVQRLFTEATWPAALSDIREDATWMDNRGTVPDRAVELLTQTAESCGGAIYGDPQTGQLVFRARDWQAWDPDLPPEGYITNGSTPPGALACCPSTWERSWRREDMTTRATLTSALREERFYSNPDAEARYGVESYERTMVCTEGRILNILGRRQLKLRGPGAFPRVAAVLLDAATGNGGPIDLMTAATFTGPSRFQCGLVRDGHVVFDRQYLVTGVRHTISRDRWQCRLALDVADVFATKGARWGKGHWGRSGDVWGRSI